MSETFSAAVTTVTKISMSDEDFARIRARYGARPLPPHYARQLKTQTQTAPPTTPPTTPSNSEQSAASRGKRFYWVRVTRRGPWLPAQAVYSDPMLGVLIPGSARECFAVEIGPEIIAPVST